MYHVTLLTHKIKCGKEEPVCQQCLTATSECQYVDRRQRPRLVQQRVAVHHLSHRLEVLEKHITRTAAGSDVSPWVGISQSY